MGQLAGDHLKQGHTNRIQIGTNAVTEAAQDLRRQIRRSPCPTRTSLGRRIELTPQTEVEHMHTLARVGVHLHEDVGWLQIAMKDAMTVDELKGSTNLHKKGEHLVDLLTRQRVQ